MNEVLKRAKKAFIGKESLSTPLTEGAYILMAIMEQTEATREQTEQLKRIADVLYAPDMAGVTRSVAENLELIGTWAVNHT